MYNSSTLSFSGVALLHMNSGSTKSYEGVKMAPRELIQEAFDFFEYAEAAYTVL